MQLHLCLSGRKTEISIKLFYVGTNFIAGILFIILTLTVNKFIAAILLPPPWMFILKFDIDIKKSNSWLAPLGGL